MSYFRFDKPKPLKDALEDFLEKFPQKKKLKQGMILSSWREVVGTKMAEQCTDVHFEGDKLIIEVLHPVWRNEIHMNRFSIMKKLNNKVKGNVIKEVVVRS